MPHTFLHLSDIHLRGEEKNTDEDLRNELARDLARLRDETGPFRGILVTGDIAYSGKSTEYERAASWLGDLCDHIDVARENVWVVPGNHDVDLTAVRGDPMLEDVRKHYRPAGGLLSLREADKIFERHMSGPTYPRAFFRPLLAYNQFAAAFGCESTHKRITWSEDFLFDDGSTLRVYGLNSALISDLNDSTGDNKLFVGTDQLMLPRESGVANVMLCHHPPEWLLDSGEVEKIIVNRADVHLFGHKHDHWSTTANSRMRIFSGALHPARDSQWGPRYNVLRFSIDNSGGRHLAVESWFRQYDRGTTAFSGASPIAKKLVPLERWASPSDGGDRAMHGEPPPVVATQPDTPPLPSSPTESTPIPRHLRYRYHRLPHVTKTEIAVELQLIEEGDELLSALERTKVILKRVSEKDLVDRLKHLIDHHTTTHQPLTNEDRKRPLS